MIQFLKEEHQKNFYNSLYYIGKYVVIYTLGVAMIAYIDPTTGIAIFSISGWLWGLLFAGGFALFAKKIFKFIRKFWYLFILLFLFLGLILFMTFHETRKDFSKKVFVLGLDGLSPNIVQELLLQNKLPHLAELAKQGTFTTLSTSNPSQSPVAWAAFSTGKKPGQNGVYDFITRDPENYKLNLSLTKFTSNNKPVQPIQEKCFWDYTTDKKIPAVILGCPDTFPPASIYGKMLSGMGVPDILGTQGTFSYYTTEQNVAKEQVGGQVFTSSKKQCMLFPLLGPKVVTSKGLENIKVYFTVQMKKDAVDISLAKKTFTLNKDSWSDWQEISFDLGLFQKSHALVRFLLIEVEPHLKLYVEPLQMHPKKPYFPISYPKKYSAEIAEQLGLYHTQGMPCDTWAVNENKLSEKHFLEQVNKTFNDRRKLMQYELNQFHGGVFFCYFEAPDIIQHMFWRYTDSQSPLYEEHEEYKNVIKHWYEKMDEVVGDVLLHLSSEDTLLILSDHGFTHFRRAVHVNSWLKEQGYLQFKNPYLQEGKELFQDVDWEHTKAYACGFGSIYLNKKGREKYGIVTSEEETEIKQDLIKLLKEWKDPKNNESILHDVYDGKDIFKGQFQNNAPDLYLGFSAGYRASWQTALGATPKVLLEDNLKKWAGDHLCDPHLVPGIFFSNKKILHDTVSIYDLTPTILHLLDFSSEEINHFNFDGKPLL